MTVRTASEQCWLRQRSQLVSLLLLLLQLAQQACEFVSPAMKTMAITDGNCKVTICGLLQQAIKALEVAYCLELQTGRYLEGCCLTTGT